MRITDAYFQEFLEKMAEDLNFKVRSYSGRFMFNKSCLAITTDESIKTIQTVFFEFGRQTAEEDGGDAASRFLSSRGEVRMDSMGLGSVIYWPYIEYTHEDEKKKNEDEEEAEG
jgi:hypothetical protein